MADDKVCNNCANGELFASGHRGCAGCGEMTAVRQVLNAAGPNTIVANATGCLEVASTGYPESAFCVPWVHAAFENAAAIASGVDAALTAMKKREGKNLLVFAGDGGTFDIGFQALSGMLERRQKAIYVVYDNEAYMNTGIQRCSSTPYGASTTTSPPGSQSVGESKDKKPIAAIVAAHEPLYTATATIAFPADLKRKVLKACAFGGPCFIHVFAPCPTGWRHGSDNTIEISRLAVDSGVFLLWEMEGGDFSKLNITYRPPSPRVPVEKYLASQGRFKHLLNKPEEIKKIQGMVDDKCHMYGVE